MKSDPIFDQVPVRGRVLRGVENTPAGDYSIKNTSTGVHDSASATHVTFYSLLSHSIDDENRPRHRIVTTKRWLCRRENREEGDAIGQTRMGWAQDP
jgi:hypothetical protein